MGIGMIFSHVNHIRYKLLLGLLMVLLKLDFTAFWGILANLLSKNSPYLKILRYCFSFTMLYLELVSCCSILMVHLLFIFINI